MSEQNSHRYAFDGQADLPSYSEAVPRRMCGRYAESSTMQASTDSNQPQAQYLPNDFDPENGSTCMTEGCSGTDTAVGGVPQLVFVAGPTNTFSGVGFEHDSSTLWTKYNPETSPVPLLHRRLPSPTESIQFPLSTETQLFIDGLQRLYQPRRNGRYIQRREILFSMGGRPGFLLRSALDKAYCGLDGRDEPFIATGTSVSPRLEFIGYASWSCQFKTLDWHKPPQPISKAKLATEIAKSVSKFCEVVKATHGSVNIDFDRLILMSFRQASKSSWQPVFTVI